MAIEEGRGASPGVSRRLESWKAIARHLGRSERTVRRWEADEGLPVHRHRHRRGSSVFAFAHELDAWRRERAAAMPGGEDPQPAGAGAVENALASAPRSSPAPDTSKSPATRAVGRRRVAFLAAGLIGAAAIWGHTVVVLDRLESQLVPSPIAELDVAGAASATLALARRLERDGRPYVAASLLEDLAASGSGLANADLAWARTRLDDRAGARSAARQALEAAYSSTAERHYAQAAHAHAHGNPRAAYGILLMLSQASPTDAHLGLRVLDACRAAFTLAACARHAERLARLEPRRLDSVLTAVRAFALSGVEPSDERLAPLLDRARALSSGPRAGPDPEANADAVLIESRLAWVRGDAEASIAALDAAERRFDRRSIADRDALARRAGEHALALGRIEDANAWFARIPSTAARHEARALTFLASLDMPGLRRHLARGVGYRAPFTAFLLTIVGDVERARALIAAHADRSGSAADWKAVRGRLALKQGDARAAKGLLEGALSDRQLDPRMRLIAADTLSGMLVGEDRSLDALAVMESAAEGRAAAALDGAADIWLLCQRQLATLYRRIGRDDDAVRTESAVRGLLREADEGHPMKRLGAG